jgi:hypothetical protein
VLLPAGERAQDADALEEVQPAGRPEPGGADRQRREAAHQLFALVGLAVDADPVVDRGAVLRRDHPQRHEHLDLGQDVLVEHRGALRDEGHPEAAGAASADEVLDGAEESLGALLGALRRERVGLVEHEVQRLAVAAVQLLGEVGHESHLAGLSEQAEVEDEADAVVDDEVGDDAAGGLFERRVAVVAAEDDDRQAGALAGRAGAQAPPDADGVADDDGELLLEHLLGHHAGGVGLADAALGEDRERLGDRFGRQREVSADPQPGHDQPLTSLRLLPGTTASP